jgi:hypothetical protein
MFRRLASPAIHSPSVQLGFPFPFIYSYYCCNRCNRYNINTDGGGLQEGGIEERVDYLLHLLHPSIPCYIAPDFVASDFVKPRFTTFPNLITSSDLNQPRPRMMPAKRLVWLLFCRSFGSPSTFVSK